MNLLAEVSVPLYMIFVVTVSFSLMLMLLYISLEDSRKAREFIREFNEAFLIDFKEGRDKRSKEKWG